MSRHVRRMIHPAAVLAVFVAAGASGAEGPPNDFAVGTVTTHRPGEFPGPVERISFSAHSGPAGEDPHGWVQVKSGLLPLLRGRVTCLHVGGPPFSTFPATASFARMEAELEEPLSGFTHIAVVVVDFGDQNPEAPPDEAFWNITVPLNVPPCSATSYTTLIGEKRGNVTIHNAEP